MDRHFLYTNDGINYATDPEEEGCFKFKLKIDKMTNDYVCFNYNETDKKDNCLKFWGNQRNEWVDHPADQKRCKKYYCNPQDHNSPIIIFYYSIHIGRINYPYELVLIDERNNNNDVDAVASN